MIAVTYLNVLPLEQKSCQNFNITKKNDGKRNYNQRLYSLPITKSNIIAPSPPDFSCEKTLDLLLTKLQVFIGMLYTIDNVNS